MESPSNIAVIVCDPTDNADVVRLNARLVIGLVPRIVPLIPPSRNVTWLVDGSVPRLGSWIFTVAVNVMASPYVDVEMLDNSVTIDDFGLITATLNVAVPVLPAASVAVHSTLVSPTRNRVPDAGAQLTATLPSTRSLADALNVATASDAVVDRVRFAGTVTTGAVVSRTMTC